MTIHFLFLLLLLLLLTLLRNGCSTGTEGCGPMSTGDIDDLTLTWGFDGGIGQCVRLLKSMKYASLTNASQVKLSSHAGTRIDSPPGHVYDHGYDTGFDVDNLNSVLLNNVPWVLIVDVPRGNITAEVMESLNIAGEVGVLFRTPNTFRQRKLKKAFEWSYVGFTRDGAKWLVENTNITFVGIDYLVDATNDEAIAAHLVFLKSKKIFLVEGITIVKHESIKAGKCTLDAWPVRLLVTEQFSFVKLLLVLSSCEDHKWLLYNYKVSFVLFGLFFSFVLGVSIGFSAEKDLIEYQNLIRTQKKKFRRVCPKYY